MPKRKKIQPPKTNGISDLIKELWQAAVNLRGSIEPADYKRYVLPLIFLRFFIHSVRKASTWTPSYGERGAKSLFHKRSKSCRTDHQRSGRVSQCRRVHAAGDRVLFANDPVCPDGIGVYHWKLENDRLILSVIDDPCAINLRAKNLSETPWLSCQPPNIEAGITDHWPKPEGCDWLSWKWQQSLSIISVAGCTPHITW